jgi:hypothetical protein
MIKLRRVKWAGHVARMWAKRNECRILVQRPEGKRRRCKWLDSIKMNLREIGLGDMDWIDLTQDRDHLRALLYVILVGKPEGKKPLGRPRRMLVYNIKMYLREIGLGGTGWTELTHNRD